eukprot:365711-Chlamydomonas_euryale.AAC.1
MREAREAGRFVQESEGIGARQERRAVAAAAGPARLAVPHRPEKRTGEKREWGGRGSGRERSGKGGEGEADGRKGEVGGKREWKGRGSGGEKRGSGGRRGSMLDGLHSWHPRLVRVSQKQCPCPPCQSPLRCVQSVAPRATPRAALIDAQGVRER